MGQPNLNQLAGILLAPVHGVLRLVCSKPAKACLRSGKELPNKRVATLAQQGHDARGQGIAVLLDPAAHVVANSAGVVDNGKLQIAGLFGLFEQLRAEKDTRGTKEQRKKKKGEGELARAKGAKRSEQPGCTVLYPPSCVASFSTSDMSSALGKRDCSSTRFKRPTGCPISMFSKLLLSVKLMADPSMPSSFSSCTPARKPLASAAAHPHPHPPLSLSLSNTASSFLLGSSSPRCHRRANDGREALARDR